MRWRRLTSQETSSIPWQVEEGGQWRVATAQEAAIRSWLPEPLAAGSLPFQPRSFRDCSLYEQHWIQSSRGYAKRFMPAAHVFTSIYERLLRKPFPAFKPHALAYRQPVYYFGISQVINTHADGDHCWGNQLFANGPITSTQASALQIHQHPPAQLRALQWGARLFRFLPIGHVDTLGRYMGDMLRPYRFGGVKVVAANRYTIASNGGRP